MTKNTAYGVAMTGTGVKVGMWAPISLQTRMNNIAVASTQGPVMDVNNVFDTMAVAAAPTAITLAAAKVTPTGETAKEFPGETANMEFTVTMTDWAATVVVKQPWNLVLKMGNQAANNRVQVATNTAWVKYPITYSDWTWGTTCTNTQWGIDDADLTDTTPAATLKNKTPKCTVTAATATNDLVIPIDQDLTSTDFSTFKIKFQVGVTMPTDLIGKTTPVTAYIMDGNMYQMTSLSSAVSILSVTKPSGQANSQATGLVSFGVDPNDATQITQGAGVYSAPFCLPSNHLGGDTESNCGISTALNADITSGPTKILELTNAIEINWALPYEIPNDRTWADIVCKTEQKSGASGALQEWQYDPLIIHQASMIAKGWGVGNCFYMGAVTGSAGNHLFQCRDMGKVAKSANLQLAFQFHIGAIGKSYTKDVHATATNNIVVMTALTLSCELKIGTWSASKTSATNWYTSMFTTNIDGNTQTNANGKWQSFIAVQDGQASLGVKAVAGDAYKLSNAGDEACFWIFLTKWDVVARADSLRQFPFNTAVTDKELYFKGYGSGLKTAATFTALLPTIAKGSASIYCINNFATAGNFALATSGDDKYAAKTGESGQPTGMVMFKFGNGKWGGSCCNSGTCDDQATSSIKQCNMPDGTTLLLF